MAVELLVRGEVQVPVGYIALHLHELLSRSLRDEGDRGGKESDGNLPSQKKILPGVPRELKSTIKLRERVYSE